MNGKLLAGLFAAAAFALLAVVAPTVVRADEVATESAVTATKPAVAADCMEKVYGILTAKESEYSKLKENDTFTKYSEKLADNVITITAKGEYVSGTWEFKLDGDYIVANWDEGDYMANFIWRYVLDAVAEYLGMDVDLVGGYSKGIGIKELEQDYVDIKLDEATKKYDAKIYVAGPYDLGEMDSWYVEDEELVLMEQLGENDVNNITSIGKIFVYTLGNKDGLDVTVAEHGGLDELAYKSLINVVKKLKPVGYEGFVSNYGSLAEVEADTYSVKFVSQKDAPEAFGELDGHYAYLNFHIEGPHIDAGKDVYLGAGDKQTLKVVHGTVKKWASSDKKVATVTSKGKVVALKQGEAKITATLADGTKLVCNLTVWSDPTITIGDEEFDANKRYQIKKGKTLAISVSGKASSVDNKYSSSDEAVAKVTSKVTAKTVKVKGVKKGNAKITVKVNGVAFKIKVKVV